MPTETLVPPGPSPSCRVDSLTCSFKLHTTDHVDELLNLAWALGHRVMPNGEMNGPMNCRLFKELWQHDSGVRVEMSPPGSGHRNEGIGIITVPGLVFASLSAEERLALYIEIYSRENFYRCTRIDTQLTVLEPIVQIYDFLDQCQAGKIWAKGYSTGRPNVQLDRAGNYKKPPTWYFGATDSPTIGRVYDHGAKWGWDIPTLRFEVQQRKQNANDTFRSLVKTVSKEDENLPLLLEGEASLCKAVCREKLDLRDTTGVDREALGGKWLRKAPRLGWYAELVDAPGAPVERQARPVPTLAQSNRAMVDQYGGKVGALGLQTMAVEGCTIKQAGEALLLRCIGSMSDQHRALAKQGLTPEEAARVDRLFAKYQPEGARLAEFAWTE